MKAKSCCSVPPLSLPLPPLPSSRVPVSSSQHAIILQHSYTNTNRSRRSLLNLRCGYQRKEWNPNPEVDTRIHWNSPDEGWISSSSSSSPSTFRISQSLSHIGGRCVQSFLSFVCVCVSFLGMSAGLDVR